MPPSNPERAEIHNYIHMGETAFMQDKWRQAKRFIRSQPRLEVILFARRLWRLDRNGKAGGGVSRQRFAYGASGAGE